MATEAPSSEREQRAEAAQPEREEKIEKEGRVEGQQAEKEGQAEKPAREGRAEGEEGRAERRGTTVHLPFVTARFEVPRAPRGRAHLGPVTLPSPGKTVYYAGLGALAVVEIIEWPVAAAIAAGTYVAQHTRPDEPALPHLDLAREQERIEHRQQKIKQERERLDQEQERLEHEHERLKSERERLEGQQAREREREPAATAT